MKPLSFRLLNDQTPVVFVLKAITKDLAGDTCSVHVQERGYTDEFVGSVKLLGDITFEQYEKALKEYAAFLALPEEDRKKVKKPLFAPVVEISRSSHEEFPYMR